MIARFHLLTPRSPSINLNEKQVKFYVMVFITVIICKFSFFFIHAIVLTLEGLSIKMLHEGLRGWGNQSGPYLDTIHPINLIFATYNELSLYLQLIETTWYLIGFHGNYNYINDVAYGCHLG